MVDSDQTTDTIQLIGLTVVFVFLFYWFIIRESPYDFITSKGTIDKDAVEKQIDASTIVNGKRVSNGTADTLPSNLAIISEASVRYGKELGGKVKDAKLIGKSFKFTHINASGNKDSTLHTPFSPVAGLKGKLKPGFARDYVGTIVSDAIVKFKAVSEYPLVK